MKKYFRILSNSGETILINQNILKIKGEELFNIWNEIIVYFSQIKGIKQLKRYSYSKILNSRNPLFEE